jgi:hypothetical protein
MFVAVVLLSSGSAHARTSTWTGAKPETVGQNICFYSNSLGGGIQISTGAAAACSNGGYVDATLVWDTAGNKNVAITGFQTAAGQISGCAVRTMDAFGNPSSTVNFPVFGLNWSTVTAAITLPLGGVSHVECRMNNSAAKLLRIDYGTP